LLPSKMRWSLPPLLGVSVCRSTRTGRHLATFTHRPGSSPYTLTTEPTHVAASGQVSASGQVAAPCSCRLLSHQTLLWHHRLGNPSLPRLHGMHSRLLVSGLPRSLPPLPPSPAPPCLPCVEGRQRAAPHSSLFPPTTAPLQTLHMDVWGPARVSGQGHERYFLLVVDDYTRYTMVFPLRSKGEDPEVLIPWIHALRLKLRERFGQDLPVLRLHSDRGGEFSLDLLRDFCRGEGILQSFTLPTSLQQNGIAERRIGLVMEIARTSMIHAAAPHFLWSFAVRFAAHQLNLWPRVSLPETSPTLCWTGKVGYASVFRVWGCRAFVRDTSADKLSARAIPCGPAPSGVSQVDPLPGTVPVEVAVDSGAARGAAYWGAESGGAASGGAVPASAEPGGAEPEGAEPVGADSGGAEPGGAESRGTELEGAEPAGAESEGAESGGAEPRGTTSAGGDGDFAAAGTRAGGAGVTAGAGGTGGAGAAGPGGARTRGTGAVGTGGVGGAGAGEPGAGDTGAGGVGAGGVGAGDPGAGAGGTGAGGAGAGGTGVGDSGAGGAGAGGTGAGDLGVEDIGPDDPGAGGACAGERREPESRPASPICTGRRVPRLHPPPIPGTHIMALRPSSVPLRVPLPPPPESSLPVVPDPDSDLARFASPTVPCLLASVVTDPLCKSTAASALVAELVDFAATCHLDYATSIVLKLYLTSILLAVVIVV
ncbi:unnamed protein product, partial [Closterium sp. NIES-54]